MGLLQMDDAVFPHGAQRVDRQTQKHEETKHKHGWTQNPTETTNKVTTN